MSKVVMMGSGAIDPINVTKRVFWRPVTETTVLKEGQPVCYNSDSVLDHKERAADAAGHLGLTSDTFAQGEQEFTGRLFVVEEPLTANLHAFAGIVKSLGPKLGADGDMIEIFTPVEGAIVPVWTDDDCTEERTVLGIRNGEADVSYPGNQIGIAQETIDRGDGADDGLCWMRFQKAPFRNANADWQVSDEADGTNVIANYIRYETEQTSGAFSALWVRAKATAGAYANAAACGGLAAYLRAETSAAVVSDLYGVSIQLSVSGGIQTKQFAALHVKLHESGATMTGAGKVSCLSLEMQITEDVSEHCISWFWLANNGAQAIDNFILCANLAQLPAVAMTGDRTANLGTTEGDWAIPVYLWANPHKQWYIPLIPALA